MFQAPILGIGSGRRRKLLSKTGLLGMRQSLLGRARLDSPFQQDLAQQEVSLGGYLSSSYAVWI